MVGACNYSNEPSGSTNFLTAKDLLPSQEGLCSLELVG